MKKTIEFGEASDELPVSTYKENVLDLYWDRWLIFKPKRVKEWHMELKKHLPPYFDTNVNKINDFSMRENVLFPPCPQEFLEHLLNGIILKNELGLYRSKFFFLRELQQLLIEYLRLFYYRIDAIIDIFQTNTKLSISKEKYPKVVVKCSNCNFYVFINVHCVHCESEFYCDETCRKIHWEIHKKNCESVIEKLPKIIEPLRIEIHVNSNVFGEDIFIYNEHSMKFSRMMKGKILLAFLYKSFRKDRWFRNNKYTIEEKINEHHILIHRGINVELDILNYETKDFVHKMNTKNSDYYQEDEFRDLLKLSILQELKLNFYKLGALLVDILKEQHPGAFKYILIFYFP
jgi:hypothetical protein